MLSHAYNKKMNTEEKDGPFALFIHMRACVKEVYEYGYITKNDGGNPYLKMLSAKMRTAQKCIQEVKTCRSKHSQTQMLKTSPYNYFRLLFW